MNILRNKLSWVCHHAHLDKSQVITPTLLHKSNHHMQEKWHLMKEIKEGYEPDELFLRMNSTVSNLVIQGCRHIRSFIDVDNTVGLMCVEQACKLKENMGSKRCENSISYPTIRRTSK